MRGLAITVLAFGCGGDPPNEQTGHLICKRDRKLYEAYVPRGALPAVQARADAAQLTDCRFEAGPPVIDHWPVEYARVEPVIPPPPPPPVPPPSVPVNVPPTILENNRIAGLKDVMPDVDTKLEIQRAGKQKVIGSYKLCITALGEVATVSQLKGTGFSAYDGKIISEMKAWKYMPYIYNGTATPVCTAVTFIYSIPPDP